MVVAYAWIEFSGSLVPYSSFLAIGGALATGAAAILGHRSAFTVKQLIFLVVACSLLGYLANFCVLNLWLQLAPMTSLAAGWVAGMAAGSIAGTAAAVLAAYLAGTLVRRGVRVRRNEEIADTFG